MEVAFRINLYRDQTDANDAISANDDVNGNKIGVKLAINKEPKQVQKLLDIITSAPESTQAQYAAQLGVSKRTVSRMFAALQAQGILEQRGTKRKAKWVIIDKK